MTGPSTPHDRPRFNREGLALLTDFYELTMMSGYWKGGRTQQRVSFDYFFRTLPPNAGFAITAGLDPFLDYLEHLRFEDDDIEYLSTLGVFEAPFLEYLRDFHPKFSVHAIPEGTPVFPFEPIVQVEGTIFESQLIETALLNFLNYQTLIATKAARICLASNGDPVLEFGLRRAHGPDGGLSGSRAAYIGGCASTSNVLAGKIYGIPVAGTHAHSWVMSFDSELEAFRTFARQYPEKCVLLVDTYDTVKSGVPNAITVFKEMREQGIDMRAAIRLDSGDLAKLSKIAYRMITEAGLHDPLIVASNDLDEDLIADLKRQGARINAWGVGTHLITARDAPSLSGVYKLVALWDGESWRPRMKISSNIEKATDPGRKQLIRYYNAEGHPIYDLMCLEKEDWPEQGRIVGRSRMWPQHEVHPEKAVHCEALLQPVFLNGKRTHARHPIAILRQRTLDHIAALPDEFKRLRNPEIYRVLLSNRIGELKERMMAEQDLA